MGDKKDKLPSFMCNEKNPLAPPECRSQFMHQPPPTLPPAPTFDEMMKRKEPNLSFAYKPNPVMPNRPDFEKKFSTDQPEKFNLPKCKLDHDGNVKCEYPQVNLFKPTPNSSVNLVPPPDGSAGLGLGFTFNF